MKSAIIIMLLSLATISASAQEKVNFKWVKETAQESARPFSSGLCACCENGKWGFMDQDGRMVIQPLYEECREFSEGLAAVKLDGKWGYILPSGEFAIEPDYEDCTDFTDGFARAKKSKWGLITKTGYCTTSFSFDEIRGFHDGMALATAGEASYYIRKSDGKPVMNDSDYVYGDYSEGYAPVLYKKRGKWGYIDLKRKVVIESKFDEAYGFQYGKALVKYKDEWRFISDKGNKEMIEGFNAQPVEFRNGFARITTATGSAGYITSSYTPVRAVFAKAGDFNANGLAPVETTDGKKGFINGLGRMTIEIDADSFGDFSNELAWICRNGKYGYVNTKGEVVIDPVFTAAGDFHEGMAYVEYEGRKGLIRYEPDASNPQLEFTEIRLLDGNANEHVDMDEVFNISVTLRNPDTRPMDNVTVSFKGSEEQEQWFMFDSKSISIPSIAPQKDTTIMFMGMSNQSIKTDNVQLGFTGKAGTVLHPTSKDWSFGTVGVQDSKPLITKYWAFKDDHTPIMSGDKVNLKLTVKNEGTDPARDVTIDLQCPADIGMVQTHLAIPDLMAGEEKELYASFYVNMPMNPELTIVAKLSDYTKSHDKVEYLSFEYGKMNPEITVGAFGQQMMYAGAQAAAMAQFAGAQFAGAQFAGAQAVPQQAAPAAFESELTKGIVQVAVPDPNKFALVIGNEDYSENKLTSGYEVNVDYAKADAEAFAKYAVNYMGVPQEQVKLLKNATYRQMLSELNGLSNMSKSSPGNIEIYLFYAGHGQHDVESKETFLIPIDVSITSPKDGIKLEEVYATLGASQAKRAIVFMDACYTGQGRGIVIKPREALVKGNTLVFTATSSSERSMPYHEKHHGMFTYYLLKAIKDGNGKQSVSELFNTVKSEVGKYSNWINKSNQTPEMISGSGIQAGWENWTLD